MLDAGRSSLWMVACGVSGKRGIKTLFSCPLNLREIIGSLQPGCVELVDRAWFGDMVDAE